jgi:hypothetical protein
VLTALRAEFDWAGHPTVLVVEDVHWADEATLDVLRYLARRIAELPAVLILTYRDDELTREHPLQQLLGQASASGRARRLPLRSLSPDAVRWLSAASRVDAGQVFALTSGNPFFVTEVLAAGDGGRVPSTVVDAVLARARRLDAATQDALDQPHRPPGPHRDDPGSAAPHAGRRRPSTRHLHCPLLSSVNIQVGRVSRPHPGRVIQALCSHRQAGWRYGPGLHPGPSIRWDRPSLQRGSPAGPGRPGVPVPAGRDRRGGRRHQGTPVQLACRCGPAPSRKRYGGRSSDAQLVIPASRQASRGDPDPDSRPVRLVAWSRCGEVLAR